MHTSIANKGGVIVEEKMKKWEREREITVKQKRNF